VKFSCETRAFGEPLVEARAHRTRDLAHTKFISEPRENQEQYEAEQAKPRGLVPRGRDAESESRGLFVPDTVVVASSNAKDVIARTQVCVESLSPCACD
jgi:hypothetical protein